MFERFRDHIRVELDEFLDTGVLSAAKKLSEQTGQHFNHNTYPMYFTGKLDAQIVLVHLNPKQPNDYSERYTGRKWLPSFETYFDYHEHFGKIHYGALSPREHKSQFDHKQIQFLKPFNVIPFIQERKQGDRYVNLELVVDNKLQLELIPYGSNTFSVNGWTEQLLRPHMSRVLDVIAEAHRDYIIFCGQVFAHIFGKYITSTHSFPLRKKDGGLSKNKARFSNLILAHNNQTIRCGIAHSFAQQGIAMGEYGKECKKHYEKI